MKNTMNLLSLSRPLALVTVLVIYMTQKEVTPAGLALYAVSVAFFLASSAVVVQWIPSTQRWQDAVLWAEIAVVTVLSAYTSAVYHSDGITTLYMPIMATIPILADRRQWRLGFGAITVSFVATSLLFEPWGQASILSLMVYAAALAFFGSTGVLMRNLTDAQAESRRLLGEVTDSRAALERAHRQLQESAARQQEMAVLEERARLAREIHDSVAHGLTVLVVQTQAARKLLDRDPARALDTIVKCEAMAREALQETRRAVRALHPSGLEQQTDVGALRRLALDYSMAANMAVVVTADEAAEALPPDYRRLEQLFRIFQEALTNAHRHGHAKAVRAELTVAGNNLLVVISNDGLTPATLEPGFGLKSMAERAQSIGGQLSLEPNDHGLTLRVTVPLKQEVAE